MNRDTRQQGAFCGIDRRSLAAILLCKHDNADKAATYASQKAKILLAMNNAIGLDYAAAANAIRESILDRPHS